MNKKLRKTFTILGLSVSVILMGCNHEMNLGNNDFSKKPNFAIEGWEEFNRSEIDDAKIASPHKDSKKTKVIAFQGILSNLSQIGAKKLTEDMESDAGVAFIDSAEDVLNGLLKFTDGVLDNYTFGFYKAVSGIIFPDETKPNPQIEKLQESVDKIQDSVDEIKFQLANLSDDLKYEFDGQKVANRIQEIERQKTAFEKMFNYLKYVNQDGKDIDLMTYYELKNYAIEAFGSVDKMRQSIQNFFTDYYKGDAVATRTYGESYKLIAEEIFPWRYQSAAFMETLIGQELDFAAKLFTIAGIMLDPNDNTNMLFDMMIQETMKNSVDAERLEKLVKMNASAGRNQDPAIFDEIMSILAKYWVIIPTYHWDGDEIIYDESIIDDAEKNRRELFARECNVAMDSWDNLVNALYEYEQTIDAIQIPVDKENEITCNIRGIKCTFSQKIEQFDYAQKLSKLAECSVKDKTEANWLKLYKTGCLPSEKTDGYVRMLSAENYQQILDFYKNHNLVITDSCLCNIVEKGNGIVGRFKINGKNKQEINLFNIFCYDAGFKFQNIEAKDAKFACLKSKEAMGFIVENERTDYGIEGPWYWLAWDSGKGLDGLHFWNVKVPSVNGNTSAIKCTNELLLEDMAARKSDKAVINRIKYYDDSKVSGTKYLIPNIILTF